MLSTACLLSTLPAASLSTRSSLCLPPGVLPHSSAFLSKLLSGSEHPIFFRQTFFTKHFVANIISLYYFIIFSSVIHTKELSKTLSRKAEKDRTHPKRVNSMETKGTLSD